MDVLGGDQLPLEAAWVHLVHQTEPDNAEVVQLVETVEVVQLVVTVEVVQLVAFAGVVLLTVGDLKAEGDSL